MAWHGRARRGLRDRCDRGRTRARRQRGAAVVEYALALSLLVVAGIGAAQFLEDETAAEVDNQADCLSTRPPPTTCQSEPLVAAGGGNQSSSGPGGGGGTPSSSPATIANPTGSTAPNGGKYDISVSVELYEDPALTIPLPDVVMTAQVTITQSSISSRVGQFFYVECVTDSSGQCVFDFDSRFDDVDQVSFDIVAAGIDTAYDFGDFPAATIDRPAP